jgi:hypothetical protein
MTTPICNCPEEIGWLPETSWPLSEASKSDAQRIYCIDGNPVIPPRGGFRTDWNDIRLAWTPVAGLGNYDAWTASGSVRSLTGAIVTDQSICNPYAYPLQLQAQLFTLWDMGLTGSASLSLRSRLMVDSVEASATVFKHVGSTTDPIRQVHHVWTYHIVEIPVGGCKTIGFDMTWTNSDPLSAFSGMGSHISTLRLWGGTV